MPKGRGRLEHGGVALDDGVYAVVEVATVEDNDEEVGKSDLMTPIVKEVELLEGGIVGKRTFYLADTEAFADPCCVVPDLGGPSNRYFVVKPRNQWAREFIRWLEDPHSWDDMKESLPDAEVDDKVVAKLDQDRPKRKPI